jgi:hypothetical protein
VLADRGAAFPVEVRATIGYLLGVKAIAALTKGVGPLIYYSTVTLVLMFLSRNRTLDNWDWPASLVITLSATRWGVQDQHAACLRVVSSNGYSLQVGQPGIGHFQVEEARLAQANSAAGPTWRTMAGACCNQLACDGGLWPGPGPGKE